MDEQTHSLAPSFPTFLPLLHQCLLSLTAAFAIAFIGYFKVCFVLGGWTRPSNYLWVWYLFIRAGVRITGAFGHAPHDFAVLSAGVIWTAFLTIVVMLWMILLLALIIAARTRLGGFLLDPIAGTFLFAVLPLGVLFLPSSELGGAWSLMLLLSLIVVAIVAGTIFVTRHWIFPVWLVLAVALYFSFFTWVYYGRDSWQIWGYFSRFDSLAILFLIASALSAITWLFFARYRRGGRIWNGRYPWRSVLAVTIPLFTICCIPWLPAKSHSVAQPKNMNSVNINLKRTSCMGMCPIYETTIHGDGTVKYEGERFVRTKGPEFTNIPPETVLDLLQRFDREGFSTIDDRAIDGCFDAPHVIITISVDSYTKTVNVADCADRSSPKAAVLELAEKIDEVVGSRQWVACHSYDCVWR